MSVLLSPGDAWTLIWSALTGSGTSPDNAAYFTEAVLDTSCDAREFIQPIISTDDTVFR